MYEWQEECVERVRAELRVSERVLVVASTGAGKTRMLGKLLRQITARTLILVNKVALVRQLEKETGGSVYCGTLDRYDLRGRIVIATVQTLAKAATLPHFDLVVVDEVHTWGPQYEAIFGRCPGARLMGLTATPYNNLGYIYGSGRLFPSVTYTKGIRALTNEGVLVRARLAGPGRELVYDTRGIKRVDGDYSISELQERVCDIPKIAAQVEDALSRMHGRKKIVWACVSIKHATLVYDALRATGELASICTSADTFDEREDEMTAFTNGDARHLVFISIVSAGWDYPPVDCIVFMRPTRSATLYVQIVGRGLRRSPGKTDCLVLDYSGVVEANGPLDDPIIRSKGKSSLSLIERNIQVKHCKECGGFTFAEIGTSPPCSHCGVVVTVDRTAASVKKLSRSHKAKGYLYTEGITWWKVVAWRYQKLERSVVFHFDLSHGAPLPTVEYKLDCPQVVGRKMTPSEMGKTRAVKAFLEHNFKLPQQSLTKMLETLNGHTTFPRLIALSETTHVVRAFSNPSDKEIEVIKGEAEQVGLL